MLGKLLSNKKYIWLLVAVCSITAFNFFGIDAKAENASVNFGSTSYSATEGEQFPVGVYINTENGSGSYVVTVQYDPTKLQYVGGADGADPENGLLAFVGEADSTQVKYWLTFNPINGGGDTSLSITSATVQNSDTGETYNTAVAASAPISVASADDEEEETEDDDALEEDLTEGAEETVEHVASVEERVERASRPGPFISSLQVDNVVSQVTDDVEDLDNESDVVTEEMTVLEQEKNNSILHNSYFVIGVSFISVIIFIQVVVALFKIYFDWKNAKDKNAEEEKIFKEVKSKFGRTNAMPVINLETDEVDNVEAVISVKDVTMEFHIASSQASGIKDYLIQLLKRQITYRKLFALYHVSFDVYKGEIVGIIGTNGSGKSTLLKIVSGALKPTEGYVKADRKKIQLLTLGTGFDMELTGKENVYQNGAIIGYSKEFLDEHYDEIVRFAELEDFMDEKVKNYSSGMVSRLGFAIATAGDAAEILILDEVLSVGDEFFRKKSLSRVKEMIHGGSTVLIVSHSMDTILSNCTKCVWIEKGELKMVDEPRVVCDAYRKMKEQEAS